MKIEARTKRGYEVCIVQFIVRYDTLYAVAIDRSGDIMEINADNLTVTDTTFSPLRHF